MELQIPVWELIKQPAWVIDGYRDVLSIERRVRAENARKLNGKAN